jgi:2-oxoglutarate dehydrogenase E2 component (dihydrolipoamide succinyltransferase)
VASIDTNAAAPAKKEAPAKAEPAKESPKPAKAAKAAAPSADTYASGLPSVAAKKMMDEAGLSSKEVSASGKDGRITKGDVISAIANGTPKLSMPSTEVSRDQRREKMTMLRKKVAERLVSVKRNTAMLTTFNEIDMSAVMNVRKQYKDVFKEKHGVGLGFMSFFTKAVTEALQAFPAVNAQIDGDEIVYHNYADVGIAVSAPKGLMVPVIRNAEGLSLAQIEATIAALAAKARDGKISVDDMTGGTFTITNGGVFGSMMSTPIINPPQSAILGMHNIVERAVVVNGKIEVRPIMYVALSYDHRIIDGRESVGFLVKVKQMIEDPIKLMTGGNDPMKVLLGV